MMLRFCLSAFAFTVATVAENAAATPEITRQFVAAALGDHMVLQREPQSAMVWGYTTPAAAVTTSFNGKTFEAVADADGLWRQRLPPMPASKKAFNLSIDSSSGESQVISDVLFGDVYLCGGQSNMAYRLKWGANATEEVQRANDFPTVRLLSVGEHNISEVPFDDLQQVDLPWAVADNRTVSDFSAVCWFFGQHLSESLSVDGDVPIGLISSNWGATGIQVWMPESAYEACYNRSAQGNHYNSMIYPFTVGPMSLSGFTWYQGENNVKHYDGTYSCLQTEMIKGWRAAFQNPKAYFGFVQLSTFCADYAVEHLPILRDQQLASLELDNVGYATNADHGATCYIHPPFKQIPGSRLGNSALALHYGQKIQWKSPTYTSATATVVDGMATVVVQLADVSNSGLTADVHPYNYNDFGHFGPFAYDPANCTQLDADIPGTCAWAAVNVTNFGWLNATVTVASNGRDLLLSARIPSTDVSDVHIYGSAYGWGPIPLLNAYDKGSDLPVLPWNKSLSQIVVAEAEELVV